MEESSVDVEVDSVNLNGSTRVLIVAVGVVVSMVVTGSRACVLVASTFLAAMGVAAFAGVEDFDVDQVEDEGHACDREHDCATNFRRVKEALGGLVEEPDGQDPPC